MQRVTGWLLVLAIGLVGIVAGPAYAVETDAQNSADKPGAPNFVEVCRYTHSASDDPIVFPGLKGRSHRHDFFGNTTTNAASTHASLLDGESTCIDQNDTAAYWVPSLQQSGSLVQPLSIRVYYRAGTLTDFADVKPFPTDLRVIAGDATATTPQAVIRWSCSGEGPLGDTPPTCDPGTHLRVHIRFPSCWDGVNLDSADHKSHLAYGMRRGCPSSHPVRVPQLSMIVHYPISGDPGSLSLTSGSIHSMHADFLNAWDQDALAEKVERCLNAGITCGADRPARRR